MDVAPIASKQTSNDFKKSLSSVILVRLFLSLFDSRMMNLQRNIIVCILRLYIVRNIKKNQIIIMENDFYTRKEISNLFQVSMPTIVRWESEGILRPISNTGKRFYQKSAIQELMGTPPAPAAKEQKRLSITDLTSSVAIQSIFLVNAISSLDAKSKAAVMKGDLSVIKNLHDPSLELFENLFFALKNVQHSNIYWSRLQPIICDDLLELMDYVSSLTGSPVIVLMGGNFHRRIIEIQEDGKIIVNAKNKPSAINILRNHLNTIQ